MEDRIAVLEREVDAIKSEVAVIRRDQLDSARATELNERTSRIELDLVVIKGDLTQLRAEFSFLREGVVQLQKDVVQLQKDVVQLQKEVGLLQRDLSQLQKDVAEMKADIAAIKAHIAAIKADIVEIKAQLPNFASKAEVHQLGENLEGWMLGIALTVMSLNFGMNVIFYNAQKTAPVAKPAQAMQVIALAKPAAAVVR